MCSRSQLNDSEGWWTKLVCFWVYYFLSNFFTELFIWPPIHLYPGIQSHRALLEPIPAIIRLRRGTLDELPVHPAPHKDKQPFTFSHTATENLEFSNDLTYMFLYCGRKPENPVGTLREPTQAAVTTAPPCRLLFTHLFTYSFLYSLIPPLVHTQQGFEEAHDDTAI